MGWRATKRVAGFGLASPGLDAEIGAVTSSLSAPPPRNLTWLTLAATVRGRGTGQMSKSCKIRALCEAGRERGVFPYPAYCTLTVTRSGSDVVPLELVTVMM